MSYKINFTDRAKNDISKLKKSGNVSLAFKLLNLIIELVENPRSGTGHPEQLKHYEEEVWSRKLNQKDRLVYEINEEKLQIFILSITGHYDDK